MGEKESERAYLESSKRVRLREHVVVPSSGSRVHLLPVVGSDSEWASRERSIKLPTVGLSMKSKLAHLDSGSTQLTEANFSSPSSHEMGESSETTAEASSDEPKPPMLTGEVADRQAVPPMVVQSSCVSGTSSDSLTVGRTEAVCSFLDGFNTNGLEVPQMVAGNGSLLSKLNRLILASLSTCTHIFLVYCTNRSLSLSLSLSPCLITKNLEISYVL